MVRLIARNCSAAAEGGCHSTSGIRSAYWLSTRASTGSVLLRCPSDSSKPPHPPRIGHLQLHRSPHASQHQRHVQTVVPAGFQTNRYPRRPQTPQPLDQLLLPRGRVVIVLHYRAPTLVAHRHHQLPRTHIDAYVPILPSLGLVHSRPPF